MGAVSPDRAGHPALSLRLLGDALPAAQAGGGGAVAAAAGRQVFVGVRRFYLAMVNLPLVPAAQALLDLALLALAI